MALHLDRGNTVTNAKLGRNRDKIPDSTISASYDPERPESKLVKQSSLGQLEFCAGPTGAKIMIPLGCNHLMSTCFSWRSTQIRFDQTTTTTFMARYKGTVMPHLLSPAGDTRRTGTL